MSNIDPAAGNFHIDKRVPIALIVTIVVQTAGIVWWAAGIQAAQEQAAVNVARIETRVDRIDTARDDLNTRVIRIEEKLVGQTDMLQRILRSVEARPTDVAR